MVVSIYFESDTWTDKRNDTIALVKQKRAKKKEFPTIHQLHLSLYTPVGSHGKDHGL